MGSITAAATRQHTFRSGREAEVRDVLSALAVFANPSLSPHFVAFSEGGIDDPGVAVEIYAEVARQMLVRPRLARPGESVPPGAEDVIGLGDLFQDELNELAEMWKAQLERTARFRDDGAGAGDGAGGEVLGDKPKRARRAAARKR
mgnify:CR=1 FL=1